MTACGDSDILVLGIGNILWADEGFGVRAVEALHEAYRFPPRVRLMDGGTQGLFLLPYVRAASHLLIFDAIDFGLPPGALRVIRDTEVPRFMGAKKVSMHQTGFQEVLSCAELLGGLPQSLVLIGVQPVELDDYGGSLRKPVRERIPQALALALRELASWGIEPEKRHQMTAEPERISPAESELARYEAGRAAMHREP
jgi:hydrogenase maturation protease